ncbi:hypothetical protein B566_EDAN002018 [Ephemera danica]|nr:hypothetical protein B566_EDAN002018 [Ephemera danica]
MMLGLRQSASVLSRISTAICKPAERISLQLHPRSYGVSRVSMVCGMSTTDQPSTMPLVLMSPSRRWKSRKNRTRDDDESSDDEDDRRKTKEEELDWTLGKDSKVYIGDEIDVVRGPSPDNPSRFILVTRIEILGAVQKDEDRLSVRVRRFPKLTIEDEFAQHEQPSA